MIIGLLFNSMFSDTYVQDYFWMLTYFLAGLVAGMPRDFWRLEFAHREKQEKAPVRAPDKR